MTPLERLTEYKQFDPGVVAVDFDVEQGRARFARAEGVGVGLKGC